jgi:hypothetical protein
MNKKMFFRKKAVISALCSTFSLYVQKTVSGIVAGDAVNCALRQSKIRLSVGKKFLFLNRIVIFGLHLCTRI